MTLLRTPSTRQLTVGLTVLRVLAGLIFAAHGGQKLFVYGFAGVTGAFGQMGVPMPEVVGPFIALLEFGGGIALVLGLLTRFAALGLALDMLGAILLVHGKNGLFLPTGSEFALMLLAVSTTLAFTGAGAFSLDNVLVERKQRSINPAFAH